MQSALPRINGIDESAVMESHRSFSLMSVQITNPQQLQGIDFDEYWKTLREAEIAEAERLKKF